MATYKEIRGVNIQALAIDPTAIEGDVWYNDSTGLLKMYAALNAWGSAEDVNTARRELSGAGTQTAGLIFGGSVTEAVAITESYDGTNWTEEGDLNTAKKMQDLVELQQRLYTLVEMLIQELQD